jgi:hypothetical protein
VSYGNYTTSVAMEYRHVNFEFLVRVNAGLRTFYVAEMLTSGMISDTESHFVIIFVFLSILNIYRGPVGSSVTHVLWQLLL